MSYSVGSKANQCHVSVPRPQVIKDYNASMGGVDKMDCLIALYRTMLKSRKWTLRVIFHFVDMATTNAWLEYLRVAKVALVPKKKLLGLLQFRLHIVEALLKDTVPTSKIGRPQSTSPHHPNEKKCTRAPKLPVVDVRYDSVGHWPDKPKLKVPLRCRFEKCLKRTRTKCIKCNAMLCIESCFVKFHTR